MKKMLTKQLMMIIFATMIFGANAQNIVITEIMYNPPESNDDSTEFIELYNNSQVDQALKDWAFSSGVNFVFPDITIVAGEYLVVAKNDTAFFNYYGFMPQEWTSGSLKNGGEKIELSDNQGVVVDSVVYDDGGDWATAPDGGGSSLVLCDVDADNNLGSNWLPATTSIGKIINEKELLANPGAVSGCPNATELVDDNFYTATDISIVLEILDNDILIGSISTLTANGAQGTTTVNADNEIEYTPPAGVCGIIDAFTYSVVMDNGQMATANVVITIYCAPDYSIGLVTTVNSNGVVDSLETICTLTGVVYGVDMIGSNGVQFTMIDADGDGIVVRNGNDDLGYTVTEGDEVSVVGQVAQFNGLTQFNSGKITMNASGNTLLTPTIVTQLSEDTEAQLISLENMHVVDMTKWSDSGSGFNVKITNGSADTIAMRIDKDVDAYDNATLKAMVDGATFNLTGLGAQYDNSNPYTDGYQVFPRYATDFDVISGTNTPSLQNYISIYPNPTNDVFVIETTALKVDNMRLVNLLGQTLSFIDSPDVRTSLSLEAYPSGIYYLQITAADAFTTMKVEKK